MAGAETVNVVSVVIAVVALAVSSVVAFRQTRLTYHANELPVLVDLMLRSRDREFLDAEEYLWVELPKLDPSLGFLRLPEPARRRISDVCNMYTIAAYIVLAGIVDSRLVAGLLSYRLLRTWKVVYPFVEAERRSRGHFMGTVEELANGFKELDAERLTWEMTRELRNRLGRLPRNSNTGAA